LKPKKIELSNLKTTLKKNKKYLENFDDGMKFLFKKEETP